MSNPMQNSSVAPYIFMRNGVPEEVHAERWCWEAHYTDDTILRQFEPSDHSFHQLREIDQQRMRFFRMINYLTGKFYDIDWHPARKLIHKYMRTVLEMATPQEQRVTSYAFGYETHFQGTTHKVILVILPNDNVVVTEDTNRIRLA